MSISLFTLSCQCFTGDTLVSTEDGDVRIDEIRPGDKVWTNNVETGEKELQEVKSVKETKTDIIVHVITDDGNEIQTTMFHPFYVKDESKETLGNWVAASNLKTGDELLTKDGKNIKVSEVRVQKLDEEITVYNLEIIEVHTYYVAGGVLVHNACADADAGGSRKNTGEGGSSSDIDRIKKASQQSYDYAVNNPRQSGMNRMQLGKDAEVQATRWTRKWAERNGIDLSEEGLHFQVRGNHSIPDVVYEPTHSIMDFKLTPKAIRKVQSNNFKLDFPDYSIEYIFGPGPWRNN